MILNTQIFNKEQLETVLTTLLEDCENSEITNNVTKILTCINTDYRTLLDYLNRLQPLDSITALRKLLDLDVSRHRYLISTEVEIITFIDAELKRFKSIPELESPLQLQSKDDYRTYQQQDAADPFSSMILYRAVCLEEYIEIFTRREMSCNGNYFSPGCPYVLTPQGTEGVIDGTKYLILLKFTMKQTLKELLKEERVYVESGGSVKGKLDISSELIKYNRKIESKYCIKHENQVMSFKMGNNRTMGRIYVDKMQYALQAITIEKVGGLTPEVINTKMVGSNGQPYNFTALEIQNYIDLLKTPNTFD